MVHAQEGTPAPVEQREPNQVLFLQSFRAGSIAPKEGEDGTYTLTLGQGVGKTVYFSNRPERMVGASPTADFLQALGFSDDNPPNAALVIDDGNGGTEVAVVELYNPLFDPVSPGVSYDIKVLGEWERTLELGFHEAPADLSTVSATFGDAHLFIDDCGFYDITCIDTAACGTNRAVVGTYSGLPYCWAWNQAACVPCEATWIDNGNVDFDNTYRHWLGRCIREFNCPTDGGRCHVSGLAWWEPYQCHFA
jgi:hypothetical protein